MRFSPVEKLNFGTSDSGLLLDSFVHDRVLELFCIEKSDGRLEWRSAGGAHMALLLGGIELYKVRDLRDGAILSEIYVWPVVAVPESSWFVPDSVWGLIFENDYSGRDAKSAVAGLQKSRPDLWAVQVGFCYGGAMAFVCEELNLVKRFP
ncbi:hypothetical protein [Lysobacter sp. 1R34A]|uniref:hypothetical protein n=1 Tax=Lysobacter sp. 1R34A TaxID=3445786 RepID=UPI003EEEF6E3